jgi:hypothetical protein
MTTQLIDTQQKCTICDKIIDIKSNWGVYSFYHDDVIKSIIWCGSQFCELRMHGFLHNDLDKLKISNEQTLIRNKVQCVECGKNISKNFKCVETKVSLQSMRSIICGDECAREAFKTIKTAANEFKKDGKLDKIKFKCSGCLTIGYDYMKCGRCKLHRYCSKDCQKLHWKAGHKEECNKFITKK